MTEFFKNDGYRTCGIFNVALLSDAYGFDRGFDHFSCEIDGHGKAASIVDEFLLWFEMDRENSFFAVLHFFDVHDPYDPPAPFDSLFYPEDTLTSTKWERTATGEPLHPEYLDHYLAMYDGEIAWVDSELSRLFSYIRSMELDTNTIIVVVADHGEEFLDHGWIEHSRTFYQELLSVPLIITGPGIPNGVIREDNAAQYDIMPTLLAACEIENTVSVDGIDLFSESAELARVISSSKRSYSGNMLGELPVVSVLDGLTKYVITKSGGELIYSLFDLDDDPQELLPASVYPGTIDLLDCLITTPRRWEPRVVELDDESTEGLEDLGYI